MNYLKSGIELLQNKFIQNVKNAKAMVIILLPRPEIFCLDDYGGVMLRGIILEYRFAPKLHLRRLISF